MWIIGYKDIPIEKLQALIKINKQTPMDLMIRFKFKEDENIIRLDHISNLLEINESFFAGIKECSIYQRAINEN